MWSTLSPHSVSIKQEHDEPSQELLAIAPSAVAQSPLPMNHTLDSATTTTEHSSHLPSASLEDVQLQWMAAHAKSQQEAQSLRSENYRLKMQLLDSDNQLKQTKQAVATLQTENGNLELALTKAKDDTVDLKTQSQRQVQGLEKEIEQLRHDLDEAKEDKKMLEFRKDLDLNVKERLLTEAGKELEELKDKNSVLQEAVSKLESDRTELQTKKDAEIQRLHSLLETETNKASDTLKELNALKKREHQRLQPQQIKSQNLPKSTVPSGSIAQQPQRSKRSKQGPQQPAPNKRGKLQVAQEPPTKQPHLRNTHHSRHIALAGYAIDTIVVKYFREGWFYGKIAKRGQRDGDFVYLVVYEDSDSESFCMSNPIERKDLSKIVEDGQKWFIHEKGQSTIKKKLDILASELLRENKITM